MIPKQEPKYILPQTLLPSIKSQEGKIKNMNYIQKESAVNAYFMNEECIKFDQFEQYGHQSVSSGSNGNEFYYNQSNGNVFFYSNDYSRYSNKHNGECFDKLNKTNKYSSFDTSKVRKDKNVSQMQMNFNQISVSACENYSNEELGELSIYLIKEQNGCKLLQKRVKQNQDFANNHLFPNLTKDLYDLTCDSFGNYLFQILFDYLSDQNLSLFLSGIKNSFSLICTSQYGTRVIQSLLEIIKSKPDLLEQLNELLTPELLTELAKDQQGNYIIQKYIIEVPYPNNQFIYNAIKANFIEIAKTKQGCCTIQKCLKDSTKPQKEELMKIIYNNMFTLITDQFGSYIFQYIIAKEASDIQTQVISLVLPKLVSICKRKYSSNAIEKCFENTNETIQNLLLKKLIGNEDWIEELIIDSFGNYVIQKALMVSKGDVYMKILKVIARSIKKLKQVTFGNKLICILITKHKELGHLIANEQISHYRNNAAENCADSAYYYQNKNHNQNYYQRSNGHNLNQHMNKVTKVLKSS